MTTPITFFGSDQYSATVMKSLIASPKTQITNLITTDTPSSHSLRTLAKTHNIPIAYYPDLLTSPTRTVLAGKIGVLASFGHILPQSILDLFPDGILCLHPSLLPQYRNTSPVPYAIALGDKVTGITLFKIDNNIDKGSTLAQQSEPILDSDTSPILLHRLFTLGADLVTNHLTDTLICRHTDTLTHRHTDMPTCRHADMLIFTKKLTSESGHLEWNVVKKLINNQPIKPSDTNNKLLQLRLKRSANPASRERRGSRSQPLAISHKPLAILTDLVRALDGWERVWTIAPTHKGNLQISLTLPSPNHKPYAICHVLISGKPNPISWADFTTYYLL